MQTINLVDDKQTQVNGLNNREYISNNEKLDKYLEKLKQRLGADEQAKQVFNALLPEEVN